MVEDNDAVSHGHIKTCEPFCVYVLSSHVSYSIIAQDVRVHQSKHDRAKEEKNDTETFHIEYKQAATKVFYATIL